MLVELNSTMDGNGLVVTHQPSGKELVALGVNDNGGVIAVLNPKSELR